MSEQAKSVENVLLDAMPGTTRELVASTGIYIKRVRAHLREMQRRGVVSRQTRFYRSNVYTWVYYRVSREADGEQNTENRRGAAGLALPRPAGQRESADS